MAYRRESIDAKLQEAFSEPMECESWSHTNPASKIDVETHEGPGKWYASFQCTECESRWVSLHCQGVYDMDWKLSGNWYAVENMFILCGFCQRSIKYFSALQEWVERT